MPVVILIFAIAALVALMRPKIGACLMWFFIWLYPNNLLYGLLPMNIRLDDLWVVYMFLICALLYRKQVGVNRLFWLATIWSGALIMGNFTGLMVTGGVGWLTIIKNSAKTLYVPLTVYVLNSQLETDKDVRDHVKWLMLAAACAGVLGILMVHSPRATDMFVIPDYRLGMSAVEQIEQSEMTHRRAGGAVGTVVLSQITMNIALLAVSMFLHSARGKAKIFFAVTGGAVAAALGYTVTRGAIGGFLGAIIWAIIFTPHRKVLISVAVIGTLVLAFQGGLFEKIFSRLEGSVYSTSFSGGLKNRMAIWNLFMEHFSPVYFLVGMGMTTSLVTLRATVHNTYLGSFVYTGTVGVVLLVTIVVITWKSGRRLLRHGRDRLSRGIGQYLLMLSVAMLISGMVAENYQQSTIMQLYFAGLVLADKRLKVLAEQEEYEAAYEFCPEEFDGMPEPVLACDFAS